MNCKEKKGKTGYIFYFIDFDQDGHRLHQDGPSPLESIKTGSSQVVKPSWHRISLSGNQKWTSLINRILCIGRSNTHSPAESQELARNNQTLRTKPMSSVCTPITFEIGHSLRLAFVFNSTMSPSWKLLHLLFHFGQVWRLHRNSLHYLNQNSFAICWMCLHLLLLNLPAFTNWPGGGNTTLDFIVRILLGHNGCSLWTSPKVSTVSGLEFNI